MRLEDKKIRTKKKKKKVHESPKEKSLKRIEQRIEKLEKTQASWECEMNAIKKTQASWECEINTLKMKIAPLLKRNHDLCFREMISQFLKTRKSGQSFQDYLDSLKPEEKHSLGLTDEFLDNLKHDKKLLNLAAHKFTDQEYLDGLEAHAQSPWLRSDMQLLWEIVRAS
eukprot:TRINITY_DN204_c0_g1_i1.p1 TRINITY_DN204_c0_g1~~TRINITY_DN204_c0_g1_i1.p1  ORF type:complete len:169 (+),score=24.96 TRINITY_DN204_c0_g1_i1:90-596(+)